LISPSDPSSAFSGPFRRAHPGAGFHVRIAVGAVHLHGVHHRRAKPVPHGKHLDVIAADQRIPLRHRRADHLAGPAHADHLGRRSHVCRSHLCRRSHLQRSPIRFDLPARRTYARWPDFLSTPSARRPVPLAGARSCCMLHGVRRAIAGRVRRRRFDTRRRTLQRSSCLSSRPTAPCCRSPGAIK